MTRKATPDIPPGELTELLQAWRAGDRDAEERVWTLAYDEFRHLARQVRSGRARGAGTGTTTLIHEAYLRLFGSADIDHINAVTEHIPGSEEKICFDKFHMAQHLGDAVDKVRREEHRRLMEHEDATLKGSRHLWLTNPSNLSRPRRRELETLRRVA